MIYKNRENLFGGIFSTMKVQLSESELSTAALVYIIRDTVGLAQKNFWIIASDNQTVSHPLVI